MALRECAAKLRFGGWLQAKRRQTWQCLPTGKNAQRRSFTVHLTDAGRTAFAAMAQAHEGWVVELLGPLAENEQTQLHQLLGTLKSGNRPPQKETK